MTAACYFDTSALAKWYLEEDGSDAFEAFVNACPVRTLSRLTIVEMRCLLARRRRAGEIDADYERNAYSLFERHLVSGVFAIKAVDEHCFARALDLIEQLPEIPLRTLDALHLSVALAAQAESVATGDRVMASAATRLGLGTQFFG